MGRLDLMIEHKTGYRPKKIFKGGAMIDSSIQKRREKRYDPKKEEKKPPRRRSPSRSDGEEDRDVGVLTPKSDMYKDYNLYLASKNGDLGDFKRILDRLLSSPASVEAILSRLSPEGNTFLHIVARHGNQEIIDFVGTKLPSLVLAKNFDGETAMHVVARGGEEAMVAALMQVHRDSLLAAKNERGNTALHVALYCGRSSVARYLIGEDPELSYQENNSGYSPLYWAAKFGFVDCVSLILRLCTDEDRVNELFKKKSPIKAAINMKHRRT